MEDRTGEPPPFQYGLKHIFALTAGSAILAWQFGPTIAWMVTWLISGMPMFVGLVFAGLLLGLGNVAAIRFLQRFAGLADDPTGCDISLRAPRNGATTQPPVRRSQP
jgi:hypothetical protein